MARLPATRKQPRLGLRLPGSISLPPITCRRHCEVNATEESVRNRSPGTQFQRPQLQKLSSPDSVRLQGLLTTFGSGLLASSCALTFWICDACSFETRREFRESLSPVRLAEPSSF